jgi:integrase/recombinase XerC
MRNGCGLGSVCEGGKMSALILAPAPDKQVVAQANLFLDHIAKTRSASTLGTYRGVIEMFLQWWIDNPTAAPVALHLESFRAYTAERFESARSRNLSLSVVRSLFRYLYESGILEEDYARRLKNFKVGDGHAKSALSKYQLHDLLEYISTLSVRNRALIVLMISNGLRVNEIANIKIEDFDIRDGDRIIWLLRKGYESKSCYTILNPVTDAILREYVGDRTEGPLFKSQKGGGLSTGRISNLTKDILRGAGIDSPSITAHSLRHTFARLALEAGVNITQIMVALNHKHLSSTQVYARAYDRHQKAAEKSVSIFGQ